MAMPGSATLRMLQRSISQPKTGTIIALKMPPNDSANEAWARSQPISAINGFRKTPKEGEHRSIAAEQARHRADHHPPWVLEADAHGGSPHDAAGLPPTRRRS